MADLGNINKLKLPNGDIVHFKDSVSGYTSNTGTITQVTTSAGAHSAVNKSSGAVSFNVPTKTSHLTNDSGFITDISGKADKATTLSGYGITDAYTKTEVDGKLSGAFHYKGSKATTGDLPTSGNSTGDVWHVNADGSEYAWNGTDWEFLGKVIDLSGYVPTSRTVNGKALSSNISLSASDVGAATSGHTHTLTLASSSDTSTVSLSANTKYKLTAGGNSIVFTTPADSAPVTSVNGQTGAVSLSYNDVGAASSSHTHTTKIEASTGTSQVSLAHGGKYVLSAGGTSYIFTMPAAQSVPTSAANATTGITIADHSTTSIYGVKSGTNSTTTASKASGANGTAPTLGTAIKVRGVKTGTNSTTTASKASGGNGTAPTLGTAISLIGVSSSTTTASKASGGNGTTPSLSFAIDSTDTNQLNISWSAGSASTWSFSNVTVPIKNDSATSIPNVTSVGTAPTWSFTDVTVPIAAESDTSIPNVTSVGSASTWTFSDVTVPIRADSATTVVTGKTHTVTDNGHTHTLA